MTDLPLRDAGPADVDALLALWHAGWHEAHAAILPAELTARRTPEDFAHRLPPLMTNVRTTGAIGRPLGLCVTLGDDLNQFYVAPEARGSGVAAQLLADGEARIAARGHGVARLDVAIGNARAERFYAKHGWQSAGPVETTLKTSVGDFRLTLLRMTKPLDALT